ncbi:hypothetical protein QEN19_002313 [Hanseniaspora menglaensis]
MFEALLKNYKLDRANNNSLVVRSENEDRMRMESRKRFVIPTLSDRLETENEILKENSRIDANEHNYFYRRNLDKTKHKKNITRRSNEYSERLFLKAQENRNKELKLRNESKRKYFHDSFVMQLNPSLQNVTYTQWLKIEESLKLKVRYTGYKSIKPLGINKTYEQYLEEKVLNKENNIETEKEDPAVGIFKISHTDENHVDSNESEMHAVEQVESENIEHMPVYIPNLSFEDSLSAYDNDEANQAIDFFIDSRNGQDESSLLLDNDLDYRNDEANYNEADIHSFQELESKEQVISSEGNFLRDII